MVAESISRSVLQAYGLADREADLVLDLLNLQDRKSQQKVKSSVSPGIVGGSSQHLIYPDTLVRKRTAGFKMRSTYPGVAANINPDPQAQPSFRAAPASLQGSLPEMGECPSGKQPSFQRCSQINLDMCIGHIKLLAFPSSAYTLSPPGT